MSEIDQMVKQYEAVEAIVRTVCLIENTEDDEDARYICLGEDGDPIIEAETLGEAVQSIIRCWNWCEGAWHKVQDEVAALTAQLAERPAERDALRKAVKDGFYEGFALGVWSAADNPRPVDLEADREWNASETKAALLAPTEG